MGNLKAEISMRIVEQLDNRMIIFIAIDGGEPKRIGEMRLTETDGAQFTCEGMDVWISNEILEGIAKLMRQVETTFNKDRVLH